MTTTPSHRIDSLDLLRGLVMVVMALDHTRDFIHFDSFVHNPLDLATTSVGLYLTRWVTHFCAPVFVFLAGVSIYLQGFRKSKEELSLFLFKRGLWLIFIELVVITFAWSFDFTFQVFVLQVIWAIGISMVWMSLLTRLPYYAVFLTGFLLVAGHNLLDGLPSTQQGWFWDLLHNGNFAMHPLWTGHQLLIAYPFVPWLGLMMLGYCFGKIYEPRIEAVRRRRWLLGAGAAVVVFFLVIRAVNQYGDPHPWLVQGRAVFTLLSFINTHKYPPSLLYLCMTIGPALIFLAWSENIQNRITRVLSVYGRVPFLFYVVHFYVIHLICMVLFLWRGHNFFEPMQDIFGMPFRFLIAGEGSSLPVVYWIWIGVVAVLCPLCHWFSEHKKRNKDWWLSYL